VVDRIRTSDGDIGVETISYFRGPFSANSLILFLA
jgi:hypothetical protein